MISRRNLILTGAALAGGTLLNPPGQILAQTPSMGDKNVTDPDSVQSTVNVGNRTFSPGKPGVDYRPVVTPNLPTLPWQIVNGIKVFHLVVEEMWHEFTPGLEAICWGYNGHVHGPTLEAVEGDRVRIYVTNKLKAPTTIHWHGFLLPNGMDGVGGLTQKLINSGQTFKYEFTLRQHGSLMYHSHHDEMTQMGMGLMGSFIIHPREPVWDPPDRDFVFMLSEWRLDNGTYRPNIMEMSDFNLLTFNAKAFPGTEPLVVKSGERVRIRIGNLSAIDNHPIHLHGHSFTVMETDGGRIPESARWPETTMFVPVGTTRTIEFVAGAPGDWPLHCHMTHHTMNQMGHNTPNTVGVRNAAYDKEVQKIIPGYMTMGSEGMGDMGMMHMAMPENSVAMMGAYGPFDYITMGGMFTVLKVRENDPSLKEDASGKITDPGWYQHPEGTIAGPASVDELNQDGIKV
ncbi:copper oxidase [candidate division BRC1 bacterium HGW-BRC1-1]|jgi:hypothetical protein|nr:MAG: copper oxidase [candidate division BRC1 bacterium HGW-BRC1-1]